MSAKRLITNKKREELRNSKKYKGKSFSILNQQEKNELLEILAKKAGIL